MAIVLPSSQQMLNTNRQMVAFSPSGTHLVYVADNQLQLRAMDQLEAAPIRDTQGARTLFFSPDGQFVGFWAGGELKKVSITGGAPVPLCETPNPYGASWAEDGRIVFAIETEGIFQVPAAGGSRELLIRIDPNEVVFGPRILPGGRAVLFTVGDRSGRSWDYAKIVVQALESGKRIVLDDGGTDVRYLPTGHLVYVRAGTLMAVPFDPDNLELTGDPVSVVEGVRQSSGDTGAAQFSVSDLGSLAYVPGSSGSEHTLVWVDRKGAEEPIKTAPRPFGQPRLSPDGRLLALEIEGDIWVYDLVRGTTTRVTFDGGNRPAWTPNGRRIAFTHPSGIFMASIDHSSEAEQLTEGNEHHSNAISPDGKTLLFHAHNQEGPDILTLKLDNQSEPQSWLATAFSEDGPSFSPDGKWIVYVSNESGQAEIYVRPFPGPGGRTKVSTDGGDQPVWKQSGEIFYKQDDQMMAVPIQTEPGLAIGRPEKLFEGQYVYGNVGPFPSYDATPDGQRFVMLKENGLSGETRQEIVVVLNWFEELKRLVPTE
jgi:serine/threonine-protein kinase